MIALPGYEILTLIYESSKSLVYQGIRQQDSQPAIVKILKQDYPTPQELTRYKQEYEITSNLNLDSTIKAYSLEKYQNTIAIVLEDFGGKSLRMLVSEQKFTLSEFLEIAIQVAESLGQIHAANIIHKDINPANIVFNPVTRQLKIIDFGISTVLSRENPTLKSLNFIEGTLAYMSPEQTGRMNRSLDYRTDFYSLGVTFYELLANELPFNTEDPLELVHSHLAQLPVPLCEINPEIPQVVSEIVMKLLAKNAEDRYQSAWGIKADLEGCREQLRSQQNIAVFPLGRQDICDKFQIPQKLYGRSTEVDFLLTAFERVSKGNSELMLVTGYSGIGKSALVQEIYKPITRQKGYFISGKFDQFQRNIPYAAAIKSFQELIRQLLTETEAQIEQWRDKILAAIAPIGQVIIDVIPEVELIIGEQPKLSELEPAEAVNRFNLAFQKFIGVFAKSEHPLAIFLDDLQWADAASLQLIQLLVTASESKYLFLIGAYRDNEVNGAHPLMLMLNESQESGAIVNTISLSPLDLSAATQLIADALNCNSEKVISLAELVLAKTGGNPFFINEFLKSLYAENFLNFNYTSLVKGGQEEGWQWNLEQIKRRDFTDNVVELMASKIQILPEDTQQFLQLAACIGNQFELKALATISEKKEREIALKLREAVAENLVFPLDDTYKIIELEAQVADEVKVEYKFAHDRIQQAAYSLISAEQKGAVHWQIGQLLLRNVSPSEQQQKIFDIVNQLNLGRELINSQQQKYELAQLNLTAGKKAKASAAYQPAFNYLQIGIELLNFDSWQTEYDLTLELHIEASETAYLSTHFEEMEKLVQIVLQQSRNLLDKVKVYEVKIEAFKAEGKPQEAIDIGLQVLKLLGITLPQKPNQSHIRRGLAEAKLAIGYKRIEDLIELPQMTDKINLTAMRILSRLISATYNAAPAMMPLVVSKQVYLSVDSGNTSSSCFAYAFYGMILSGISADTELCYQFGQLALSLLSHFNAKEFKAKTLTVVNYALKHLKDHLKETLKPLLEAYSSGVETGDLEYTGAAAVDYCIYAFLAGKELAELEAEIAAYSHALTQIRQERFASISKLFQQAILNLMGEVENPCQLIGAAYNEEIMLPIHSSANDITVIALLHFFKLNLYYLFGEYEQAIHNAETGEKFMGGIAGSAIVPVFYLYDSLARIAVDNGAKNSEARKQMVSRIRANQKKMKKWAEKAPMNYLHKFYLVEAELQRILGKDAKAMDLYDRAIALAKENDYLNEEAIAQELAAKFYLAKGKIKIAQSYMLDARYCYLRWGASSKVKHLDKTYPQLLAAPIKSGITTTKITASMTSSGSDSNLDLASVVKASQAIAGEIFLENLLAKLMKIALENAGAQKGFLLLPNIEQGGIPIWRIEAAKVDGRDVEVLQSIPIETYQNLPISMINYVARSQSDVVLSNAAIEGIFTTDTYITLNQPKSVLCAPIVNQGKLAGIFYLENNLTTGAFTPDRLEVLRILSSQAAISIENAILYRTLEQKVENRTAQLAQANQEIIALNNRLKADNIRMTAELDVTRRLQQMLLPKNEELQAIDGLDIAGFMEPADEVGGDYYDVLKSGDRVKIGIGDVTGHGLESGVLMIMAQTAVRTLLEGNFTEPKQFLDVINRTIYNNAQRMSCDKNMTLAILDYSNSGFKLSGQHEEVIVVRSGGEVELIDTEELGFPIALVEDIADFVSSTEVQLNPGDVAVLYTDGITEAIDINNVQYSLERLIEIIRLNYSRSANEIRGAVVDDVKRHIGEQKVYDDITLVVLKQK